MKIRFTLLFLLVVAGLARPQEPDDIEALKTGQPKDVASFVSRAFECQHFLGEPGYDGARMKEIGKALKKWKCDRLDFDRVRLTQKYRNSPKPLTALRATDEF